MDFAINLQLIYDKEWFSPHNCRLNSMHDYYHPVKRLGGIPHFVVFSTLMNQAVIPFEISLIHIETGGV